MRALVVWEEGGDGTSLIPIECSFAELRQLEEFHNKFISHVDNTDELDNRMLEFFYTPQESAHGTEYDKLKWDKYPGPLKGHFDLIILTGIL